MKTGLVSRTDMTVVSQPMFTKHSIHKLEEAGDIALEQGIKRMMKILINGKDDEAVKAFNATVNFQKYTLHRKMVESDAEESDDLPDDIGGLIA